MNTRYHHIASRKRSVQQRQLPVAARLWCGVQENRILCAVYAMRPVTAVITPYT